jgi:integrase
VYEGGGSGANRKISAKTRSWAEAEKFAEKWREQWDEDKQELKRLRAEKERKAVRIEQAVALYCADLAARLGDNGTLRMVRSLLGHIDPETGSISKNGHLFDWLDKFNSSRAPDERIIYISQIGTAELTAWRASWNFGSDLTASQRWTMVKGFFTFCESQGWIADNPARKLKRITVAKGNRTAIFTDEQYGAILDAVAQYDPDNVPAATRKAWQQRLTTFIELLRWSGMALIDAIQYRPELLDAEGVLRYRRQKTGFLATVPLPSHVITLLRDIPLAHDSVGHEMPFRTKNRAVDSDTHKMMTRMQALFRLAGIKEVRTEQGRKRTPHIHMMRDSFAVWHLQHGARIHTISKMLGHAKTTTTEKAYLPWVKELEEAHIADARKALAQAAPKARGKVVGIAGKK